MAVTPSATATDRGFLAFNAVLSAGAVGFLAYLLLVRHGSGPDAAVSLRFLPAVNAGFNALAASFLVAGYVAIRRGLRRLHKFCMVSAFAASSLFLIGYVAYHYVHGDTHYAGIGVWRTVYLTILASHVLLSMAVLPLALTTLYLGARGAFARHRRLARWTLPLWLYVSVTGVVIFFMLRGSLPASP